MKRAFLMETPPNNHGCRGFEVTVAPLTGDYGLVIGGSSCSSCWQVGHDSPESPIPVGTLVALPTWDELLECHGEGTPVWNAECDLGELARRSANPGPTWEEASMGVGFSHNECISDWDDPQPDTTLVGPWDLHVLGTNEGLGRLLATAQGFIYKLATFRELKDALWEMGL